MGWLFGGDDGRRGEDDGPRPLGIRIFELNDIGKIRKGFRLFYL